MWCRHVIQLGLQQLELSHLGNWNASRCDCHMVLHNLQCIEVELLLHMLANLKSELSLVTESAIYWAGFVTLHGHPFIHIYLTLATLCKPTTSIWLHKHTISISLLIHSCLWLMSRLGWGLCKQLRRSPHSTGHLYEFGNCQIVRTAIHTIRVLTLWREERKWQNRMMVLGFAWGLSYQADLVLNYY